jgi:formamidopyrimidine-DNA glycosylase
VRVVNPFVLRSVSPAPDVFEGRRVVALRRIGKRIVIGVEGELFIVLHLMIAGRLRWRAPDKPLRGKLVQAAFEFESGTLFFTEAGSKRALTDPRLFSGIGNAYSDEILHRARMAPTALTRKMSDDDIARLYAATRAVLVEWTDRLRAQTGAGFPEKVTAFHEEMAVHGRFRQPCPVCGSPVQRIVYADNETNYCARCQTNGRILADRALSRLLREDWPRSIDEVE